MKTPFIPFTAFVLATVLSALPAAGAGSESGWFVLRQRESGDCWTARLIMISGQYASGTNQIAGGPFASEADAEAHLAQLVERATCRPD